MRLPLISLFCGFLLVVVPGGVHAAGPKSEVSPNTENLYDPDPAHLWNRLRNALFVREAPAGAKYGADELDPLLWDRTEFLTTGPSNKHALDVLDDFLRNHAEGKIRDPLKKAILEHDLWAVFDWSVRRQQEHSVELRELQIRLANVLRRLALTPEEIKSLPDNYAQAVASGEFAREYDPAHRDRAFLPPDLFQPRGPWVCISGKGGGPVALRHVASVSGRSRFLVFVHLPAGRESTLDYFRTLWEVREPWVTEEFRAGMATLNPNLPQFPAGTEVALVRQMMLIDGRGALVAAPITESVQFRVFRTISTREDHNDTGIDWKAARTEQDFYEARLSRALLFSHRSGGLKAVTPRDKEYPVFMTQGEDPFEFSAEERRLLEATPILDRCVACHSAPGINSLQSRGRLLKPNRVQQDPDPSSEAYGALWWENEETISWKQNQYDWGLLNGYWKARPRPQ
jgi:hypothetical protein